MTLVMRQERIARGWTQAYVAGFAGVSAEAIQLIETGQRSPSYTVLVRLENLFFLSHRELFTAYPYDMPDNRRASPTDMET